MNKKGSKPGRPGKQSNKGSRKPRYSGKVNSNGRDAIDGGSTKSSSLNNDFDWYNVYPDLVRSTANIPTGFPIGINLPIAGNSSIDWFFANDIHTMRFKYLHGVGLANSELSAVNMAATRLYSYVRHANSGHANYERTDLMLYFLGVMEVYHWIGNAMRVYGAYNTYNTYNREIPVNMIKAFGWSYDSIADNAAQLRSYINNAIARVNGLYVPLEMNVMKRWWYLVSNVFTDSPGPKAGLYVFTPTVYRTYEETDDTPGYLKSHNVEDDMTVSGWNRIVNTMLDKLLSSEDIGIISGDILKAYQDRVFTLSYLPENHTTNFIYSEEMLCQINNMRIPSITATDTDITQVDSGPLETMLHYQPVFTTDSAYALDRLSSNPFMNFQTKDPSPEMVMVSSRLTTIADEIDYDNNTFSLVTGSEVVVHEEIYTAGFGEPFTPSVLNEESTVFMTAKHTRFDYAPIITVFAKLPATWVMPTTSHYENVVPITGDVITNMHDTALLSLFTALV